MIPAPTDDPRCIRPMGVADRLAGAIWRHLLAAAEVSLRTLRQVLARFPRTEDEPSLSTKIATLPSPLRLQGPLPGDSSGSTKIETSPSPQTTTDDSSDALPQPTSRLGSEAFTNPPPAELLRADTQLPDSYGSDRIVLLARDPHCLYAYWDLSDAHCRSVRAQAGAPPLRLFLRIYDVTRLAFDSPAPTHFHDVAIVGDARSVYVSVSKPAACFVAEVGYMRPDGAFFPLARSQPIWTPRADQPGAAPGRLMTVGWDEHAEGGEVVPSEATDADTVDIGMSEGVVATRQAPSSWSGPHPSTAQHGSWSLRRCDDPTTASPDDPAAARREP